MGDHRASIKCTMEMHDLKFEQEWWINWSPDDDGCDRRIVEWFAECAHQARAKYDLEVWESQADQRARQVEATERAEFERLRQKYER